MIGGDISGYVFGLSEHVASNVNILVDGVKKTKTDKNGRYYLSFDRIPGKYEIEADNDAYFFEPITV